MIFEKTIADDYAQYIDDERGYNYDAWDTTSIEQTRSHDRILHATPTELAKIDTATLNDLERWARAQALRTHQQLDAFFSQCEQLITSDSTHPALNYSEILEAYLEQLASEGQLEQALNIFKNTPFTDLSPDLEGRITLIAGDENTARSIFDALAASHPDDAELRFDIAENFANHNATTSAHEWLNQAQDVAKRTNDQALLVDIELLRLDIPADSEFIEE